MLFDVAHAAEDFAVFDGTLYKDKPDLTQRGVVPIHVIYGGDFWDRKADMDALPTPLRVRDLARAARKAGDIAVIDIEHWPTRAAFGSVDDSLLKYRTVLRWFRDWQPDLRLGYYGVPPIRDYWRAIKGPNSAEYVDWQRENERLAGLATDVDVLFPSVYTFYEDRGGWVAYALAQVSEARRYGANKPVYAFLCPQYHNSNKKIGGQFIEPDYWRLQLDTIHQHADGVVIWGGWKDGRMQWDEDAPWWRETKEFLREIGKF